MDLVTVTGQVTLLRFDVGQVYLWRDGDAFTLIDTGIAGSADAISGALGSLGGGPGALQRIVLTHCHDDHAGSAAEMAGRTGAEVLAGADDAPFIRGEQPQPAPNITERERPFFDAITPGVPPAPPCRVDRELQDGDTVDFGGGATVVHVPGHTPGSIALYLPAHRVLFTGDTIASVEGKPILGPFNVDRTLAKESFRRQVALDVNVACFGHGDPLVGDAAAALRAAAR
jgi:glyoxylase-like metal-dependent hydrolase (beta-lactamase superfamily II)